MRVIGVLDLAGGRAVHARAGERARYLPILQVAGEPIDDANPSEVADVYVERLGLRELYAADLDAIAGRTPQEAAIRNAAARAPLWLDAGISSASGARRARALGAERVVMGLETLRRFDDLRLAADAVGGERLAFSLDLRDGRPLATAMDTPAGITSEGIARRAADQGIETMIVIDLSRVGTRQGPDYALIERLRRLVPGHTLVAGGGVLGPADLRTLTDCGCDAVLVANALHDGTLSPEQIRAVTSLPLTARRRQNF
jgi:phosphoribosylformimino-5-aminoimidazole carboxamide ribotide isomerase